MLKRMRLRDKMTLWYTLLVFLMTAAFSLCVYFLIAYVLEEMLEDEVRLSMEQVAAQVENEDEMLSYEGEVPVASDMMVFITEKNGSELYSHGADITLMDDVPVQPEVFRFVNRGRQNWLVLDSDVLTVDYFEVRIRIAASCGINDRVLSTLRLVLLIALPILILLSLLGGRMIAGRALQPIRHIAQSADSIAEGDLSARIPSAQAKDELGELTDTLNRMLDSVETAFTREKRFTSDASHELRTPVAVLRAYTETMMSEPGTTDAQNASLTTMLRECERMQKIIGRLLTITRGQEGRYPVSMEEIALLPICEGVRETLTDRLMQRQMSIVIEIEDSLKLQGDQSLLTELLMNLVENAVKYGNEGGHISVCAHKKNRQLVLTVSDDGIGIPSEALPHVFERFYRVDVARDRSGTGLGLSICDWIVRAHDGTIHVESELGRGTRMQVMLPMR